MPSQLLRTFITTSLALLAFAGNSVLCRLALKDGAIDAASFTNIRLLSGALVLIGIIQWRSKATRTLQRGSWTAALMLFIYAASFSYAYVFLNTGVGALLLFGAVQVTIICISVASGKILSVREWLGMLIAFSGFTYLMLPGQSTPSIKGALLMSIAGIAWGVYTIKGKGSTSPLVDTGYNFARSLPLVFLLFIFTINTSSISSKGLLLACMSGIIASGFGYALWYAALSKLSNSLAAVLQLLVPIIASFGGILLTDESLSLNFVIATGLVLGGIALVMSSSFSFKRKRLANN